MSVSLRAICQFSGQRVSIQQEMGKALIIAEKPSVATDISKALGGFKKQEDYYESDQYVLSSVPLKSHTIKFSLKDLESLRRSS